MTWYSALVTWWHRISSQRANDRGNENDFIFEIVNATRMGRWELTKSRLRIGIMEVDIIKRELSQTEKELSVLNQDMRIFESLKSKL